MLKPSRSFNRCLLPLTVVILNLACGQVYGDETDPNEAAAGNSAASHLEQAAKSIVAAVTQKIASPNTSDEEAVQHAQLSFEAIRILGMLGDIDADAQSEKLMDAITAAGRPAVVDALFQVRFTNNLRRWPELEPAERTKLIDGFVARVQKSGMNVDQGKMLIRLATMLGDGEDNSLAIKAVKDLLPTARNSKDATVGRMVATLEGTLRRLELPGKPLELEGALLDGSQFDWASYRGKVVLVDFFASWCGPCREEVPNVLANYETFHDKGFEVVGINLNTNDERSQVDEYMQQTGFNFPTLFSADPEATGWDHPLAKRYGITAIPRAILVDKEGKVVSTSARGDRLRELLGELLGPAGGATSDASSNNRDESVKPASGAEEVEPEPTPLK
jgi:thiol-disulfide isomerase/thioredoxin